MLCGIGKRTGGAARRQWYILSHVASYSHAEELIWIGLDLRRCIILRLYPIPDLVARHEAGAIPCPYHHLVDSIGARNHTACCFLGRLHGRPSGAQGKRSGRRQIQSRHHAMGGHRSHHRSRSYSPSYSSSQLFRPLCPAPTCQTAANGKSGEWYRARKSRAIERACRERNRQRLRLDTRKACGRGGRWLGKTHQFTVEELVGIHPGLLSILPVPMAGQIQTAPVHGHLLLHPAYTGQSHQHPCTLSSGRYHEYPVRRRRPKSGDTVGPNLSVHLLPPITRERRDH